MALNIAFHNLLTLTFSFFLSFKTWSLWVTAGLDIFIFVSKGEVLGSGRWVEVYVCYAQTRQLLLAGDGTVTGRDCGSVCGWLQMLTPYQRWE